MVKQQELKKSVVNHLLTGDGPMKIGSLSNRTDGLNFGCTLNRVDRLNSINTIFCFRHRKRGILIGKIKSTITNITKNNTPMNNNTRKLLNLTDDSLIFNGD